MTIYRNLKFIIPLFLLLLTACSTTTGKHQNNVLSKTIVKVLVKSEVSWNGKALPKYPKTNPEITILKITIPPKFKLPEHYHPVINAGVLISGQLTVITKNNKKLKMKAGDALIEVVDTIHYGQNNGNIPAEIIVFYVGSKGTPLSVIK